MSGDLSALVARLEAVTSRLEAAADKSSGGEAGMNLCWKQWRALPETEILYWRTIMDMFT